MASTRHDPVASHGRSAAGVADFVVRLGPWLLWTAAAVISAGVLATAVVDGKNKTTLGLLGLSAALILSGLSRRWRFRALLVAVLLGALLFRAAQTIEFQPQPSQILVLFVVAAEVVVILSGRHDEMMVPALGSQYYVPFALFALFGMVSTYVNGELPLYYWVTTCLTPLLLLFAVDHLVENEGNVVRLLQAALAAILVFTAIVWVAQKTGHSYLMPQYGVAWRFADARSISVGPLSFEVFSIRLGSLVAFGMPVALILAARSRRLLPRVAYVAVIFVFVAVLAFTAARGAIIGAAAGMLVAAVVSRRFRSPGVLVGVVTFGLLLVLAGTMVLHYLPSQGIARILDLRSGLGAISTFTYRVNVWDVTVRGILSAPLGPGFQYLWYHYHLDEAVAYSVILNGTGILGFAAFVWILAQLVQGFLRGMRRVSGIVANDLGAIGLGTLAAALIAGVSSQSVFVEPVQAVVLWTILAATATGVARFRSVQHDGLSDIHARTMRPQTSGSRRVTRTLTFESPSKDHSG